MKNKEELVKQLEELKGQYCFDEDTQMILDYTLKHQDKATSWDLLDVYNHLTEFMKNSDNPCYGCPHNLYKGTTVRPV